MINLKSLYNINMCLCETIGCIIGNFCLSYCDIDTIMITINRVQVSKMAIIKILT